MNQRLEGEDLRRAREQYAGNKLYAAISSIGDDLEAELTGFGMCAEECFEEVMEVLALIAEKGDDIASDDLKKLWLKKFNQYRRLERQVDNDEIRKVISIVFGYAALALDSSQTTFYRFTVCYMVQQTIIDNEPEDFDPTIGRIFDVELEKGWLDHFMEENDMETYENLVFKENVDVGKVMKQLTVFVRDKILKSQKHWFIAYQVFQKKDWLKKKTQSAFRDQVNAVFEKVLKCTDDDFRKVDKYFKDNDYADWSLDCTKAPPCCEDYIQIAEALDHEFTDKKYAKPGTTINTRKVEKFR